MAGVILPNAYVTLNNAAGDFSPIQNPPAGKAESCCIMACLGAGVTVDAYCSLVLFDTAQTPNGNTLVFTEALKYRQPGSNPVLLQDFILTAGQHIYAISHTAVNINFMIYNRWLFDA